MPEKTVNEVEHRWQHHGAECVADRIGIKRGDGNYIVGGTICNREILRLAGIVEGSRSSWTREQIAEEVAALIERWDAEAPADPLLAAAQEEDWSLAEFLGAGLEDLAIGLRSGERVRIKREFGALIAEGTEGIYGITMEDVERICEPETT